ncbi:hypothetical protein [Streptomyces sp. AcE210]|uniref:hypothetical protein n=1 Tax=Streptomyces sp. AcE210 TaxID=2292703 RepID=UPI000E3066ED|nr:hypothetical protein [Streptomyces sp. AcE210]RFC71127.1 hypothetical protein DXZ75_28740 [Streptomyces sp. AcE210]
MPRTHLPLHHRNPVHQILAHTHTLFTAIAELQATTRLEDVLVQAAAGIEESELFDGVPKSRS